LKKVGWPIKISGGVNLTVFSNQIENQISLIDYSIVRGSLKCEVQNKKAADRGFFAPLPAQSCNLIV
jgi:hypothetical protein